MLVRDNSALAGTVLAPCGAKPRLRAMSSDGMREEPAKLCLAMIIQVLLGAFLLRWSMRFLFRNKVRFAADLPAGPILFACNHRSFLDPPYVGTWIDRPMSYFARANLWKIPVAKQFLNIFGGLPIDRDMPQMAVMRQTVEWLRGGRRILVFPEGTRTTTGRMGEMREGAAMFSRRADVPIVPVYVHNSDRVWPRGALFMRPGGAKLEIRYGAPVKAPAHLSPRMRDRVLTEFLRRWMARQERDLRGPA